MFYRKNVGTIERWLRFAAGCGMLACGFIMFGTSPLGLVLAGSGVMTIATGVFGFCPACALAGRKLHEAPSLERSH